jgi:hypothetical protein
MEPKEPETAPVPAQVPQVNITWGPQGIAWNCSNGQWEQYEAMLLTAFQQVVRKRIETELGILPQRIVRAAGPLRPM